MASKTDNPRRTVGYCRVSTEKQADKGFSLEAQTERIRAMAVVQGVELSEIIVDAGESGKNLGRPGTVRLLDLVNRRVVGRVIVAKLDRLTRSVKDLASLLELFEKRGTALVSVAESLDTQSAAGRLVLNIMVSVSEWEREAIGERTASVLQHKKAHKQVFNHEPYGFAAVNGKLVALPEEQAIVTRMKELRYAGVPLAVIAARLNEMGVPTKRAGRWYPSTVSNVLQSSLYE